MTADDVLNLAFSAYSAIPEASLTAVNLGVLTETPTREWQAGDSIAVSFPGYGISFDYVSASEVSATLHAPDPDDESYQRSFSIEVWGSGFDFSSINGYFLHLARDHVAVLRPGEGYEILARCQVAGLPSETISVIKLDGTLNEDGSEALLPEGVASLDFSTSEAPKVASSRQVGVPLGDLGRGAIVQSVYVVPFGAISYLRDGVGAEFVRAGHLAVRS